MGIYVNPGDSMFRFSLNSKIYVDKSPMINELNELIGTDERFLCMSRARRFGKTMMTNLMSAYYSRDCNSREIFERLELSKQEGWDKYLNAFNVIQIDLQSCFSRTKDKNQVIDKLQTNVVNELREQFPSTRIPTAATIAESISIINKELGELFVIIIDEYDVLIRDNCVAASIRKDYIDFLNSIFKSNDVQKAVSLAYLTGILPILRETVQSKLNNFTEYTMLRPDQFAQYFGFTENEVRRLCLAKNADYDACKLMYDGYIFEKPTELAEQPDDDGEHVIHVFNPNSVVKAVTKHKYDNYWVATSALEAITLYIDANIAGILEDIKALLKGEKEVKVDVLNYNNNVEHFATKDEIFTYLIHLGYLAYDPTKGTCHIPNGEIRGAWLRIMSNAKGFEPIAQMIETSRKLIEATENGDKETVAKALDDSQADISSPLSYNRESTMQSAILMAYFYARKDYWIFSELASGCGYADVVLVPFFIQKPIIIIELKKDGEPATAIEQIKSRNYAHAFRYHPGHEAVLVGITYDAESKQHRCLIEKVDNFREKFGIADK
ncbi:MAG: AAA family ATPase [Marinilabiliaceae bacterium]|nr:ATP-binding protein [Bacteroidales bacterium]